MSDKEGVKERSRSRSTLRTKSPDNEIEDDDTQQSDLDNYSNLDDKSAKDESNSNCDDKPSEEETKKNSRYILVENLPTTNYTRRQLTAMLGVLMGPDMPEKVFYKVLRDNNNCPTGKYIFKFTDETEQQKFYKSFKSAKLEGKSINPQLDPEIPKEFADREFPYVNTIDYRSELFRKTERITKTKPNVFIKQVMLPPEALPDHTFGLSLQFLKTLNIEPPLRRKVCVLHLCSSVDEAKLREVFSLAGQVMDIKVIPPKANFPDARAFVEFDHPVEAVQAISMFHNQKLNGKKMIVKLDNLCKRVLPKGLEGIGPGLGLHGEPLRGVRVTMEIKSLEQKIEKEHANKEQNQNTPNPNKQLLSQLTTLLSKQTQGTSQSQSMPNNEPNPFPFGSNFGQNPSPFGSNFGQNPSPFGSNFGQNPSPFGSNFGQNPSPFGSNFVQNAPIFGSNTTNFGQNTPPFGTNTPFGPNASNFGPTGTLEFGTGWNFGPNTSNFGQIVPNFGSDTSNFGLNKSNFGSEASFEQVAPKILTFTQNAVPSSNTQNLNTQSTAGMQSAQIGSDGSHYVQQHSSNDLREFDFKSRKRDKDSGNSRIESNKKKPDTLIFSYLPTSVDAESLNMKLKEVGELVFGEVTGKGRAVVRFKNRSDSDKCIKLFDGSKVDGQVISVKYF